MMEEQGYSQLFYVMLVLGVIGVVGFILVAAGVPGWILHGGRDADENG
ncbi:MAG: hypothetical protein U0X20_00640 [Caldilineaceae bacterium]